MKVKVGRKHLALLEAATASQLWEQTLGFVLHPKSWDTPELELKNPRRVYLCEPAEKSKDSSSL